MPAYTVSWQNPNERQYDIAIAFTAPADRPRLLLPLWRPGRYIVQNYAANVSQWAAAADGDARDVWKDGKSSWRVDARAGEDVIVRYRYYAGVLDAGSSFLDEREAYFNGSNLFMMVEGLRGESARLTIGAPADWRIETQLPCEDEATFVARDYDHLIDSPVIAAASMTRHSFQESGGWIHLVVVDDDRIDTEQYVDPLRAIVRAQAEIFGGLPLDEYRFLVHVGERWHGVEHESSSSIVAKRSELLGARKGDKGYDEFLGIASHEFFHLWNVKRILPAAFAPYDYWNETLTRLLWVMEGLTSYYASLTLLRAGVWDEKRYLQNLAQEIETLESAPAREHLSLSQSSFDSWLVTSMHDRANASISFYNKGEVVSALLDILIRRETGGEKSLDDVMRAIWNARKPLEEDGFRRAVESVCDVGDFFARYVDGTDPLPYAELFGSAGVAFESTAASDTPSVDAKLEVDGGRLVVVSAMRGGAGHAAGLLPDDEIVSIDGTRTMSEADVRKVMRSIAEGTSVEMLVARGGVVRAMPLVASSGRRVKITLRRVND